MFLDRVEKDGETVGERDKGRVRNKKKWLKILKKEYLNEVEKKIECLMFGIL